MGDAGSDAGDPGMDGGGDDGGGMPGDDGGMPGDDGGMPGDDGGMPGDDGGMPGDDGGMPGDDGGMPGDDGGMPGDDGGMPGDDGGMPGDGGAMEDAPSTCVPDTCAPTECGVGVRDDGCGTPLDCGTCGLGGGCLDDAGCNAGLECVSEAESGWTDGLCTRECRTDADCTATSHCAFRAFPTLIGVCVRNCTGDADCRPGYTCRNEDGDPAGTRECAPAGVGTGAIGDPCSAHSDCGGGADGFCLIEGNGWRQGYCTQTCSLVSPCPAGSHCGNFNPSTGEGICVKSCTDDTGCRADGYLCYDWDGDPMNLLECAPAATGTGMPGDACTGDWDCDGGLAGGCFGEESDFHGGSCLRLCVTASDCPTGSHCSPGFQIGGAPVSLCLPNCVDDSDCRADGYACFDVNADTVTECWPAGTGTTPVGGPCEGVWDCVGREDAACLFGQDFRDGYCTILGCTAGSCPAGSHCGELPGSGGGTIPVCLDDCGPSDLCRAVGYACYDTDEDGTSECWSAATGSGAPGEPCLWRSDCAGGADGFCFMQGELGLEYWPGGYCSRLCDTTPCPAGSFCYSSALCLRSCTSDSNCRADDGYSCIPLTSDDQACLAL